MKREKEKNNQRNKKKAAIIGAYIVSGLAFATAIATPLIVYGLSNQNSKPVQPVTTKFKPEIINNKQVTVTAPEFELNKNYVFTYKVIDSNQYSLSLNKSNITIENKTYAAAHHPFTSPTEASLPTFDTDKANARARAYDIVLNGYEIGGGSIRITNVETQNTSNFACFVRSSKCLY